MQFEIQFHEFDIRRRVIDLSYQIDNNAKYQSILRNIKNMQKITFDEITKKT